MTKKGERDNYFYSFGDFNKIEMETLGNKKGINFGQELSLYFNDLYVNINHVILQFAHTSSTKLLDSPIDPLHRWHTVQ